MEVRKNEIEHDFLNSSLITYNLISKKPLSGHDPAALRLLHRDVAQHLPDGQPGHQRELGRRIHPGPQGRVQMCGARYDLFTSLQ